MSRATKSDVAHMKMLEEVLGENERQIVEGQTAGDVEGAVDFGQRLQIDVDPAA